MTKLYFALILYSALTGLLVAIVITGVGNV